MQLPRLLIRTVLTALHRARRALWRVRGPGRAGVHAIPVTPSGKVVLVRLTYAPGWRLPGGGLHRNETPLDGALRELEEEIGLLSHERAERLPDTRPDTDRPGDRSALFILRAVRYRPRWNLEVEETGEFDPRRLPDDTASWTRSMLDTFAADL